ncbi:MAG: tetratricopeptide repeat protein [Proteobacteria bacterium]|nr:tetratricopeptide repeat protein [Pseudomonadota bacterium]
MRKKRCSSIVIDRNEDNETRPQRERRRDPTTSSVRSLFYRELSRSTFVTIYLMCIALLPNCATVSKITGSKKDAPKPATDGAVAPQIIGDAIVIQPMAKTPIISAQDPSHWINLRSKGKDDLARMRGQLATGDWQAAVTSGKSFMITHPDHPEAMMGIAGAYAIGKRYEMAGYYAHQVLKIQPSNSDAMNILGLRVMMATGNRRADYQHAISWFQKSLEADGTQIAAGLNLGHLQLELAVTGAAVEAFATTSPRCGDCDSGLMGLGISSARAKRGEDAKSAFEKILARNSYHAEAKYQLALNYRNNLGDSSRAAKLLQDIVSDAEGHYRDDIVVKRQANIALRRIRATDRSGENMKYRTQTARPHSREKDMGDAPPEAVAAPYEESELPSPEE